MGCAVDSGATGVEAGVVDSLHASTSAISAPNAKIQVLDKVIVSSPISFLVGPLDKRRREFDRAQKSPDRESGHAGRICRDLNLEGLKDMAWADDRTCLQSPNNLSTYWRAMVNCMIRRPTAAGQYRTLTGFLI